MALAGVLAAAPDFSQWAEFRGPTGQGHAKGPAPTKWGLSDGVAWKVDVPGEGWSSPLVVGQSVILTTAKKDGDKATLAVLAFDRASGKLKWEKNLFEPTVEEQKAIHSKNSLASSTPIIADGVIYCHFAHMGTAALKLDGGEVIWKRKFEFEPRHGTGSSPVLVDDLMVVNMDSERPEPRVVALSRQDGKTVWETTRDMDVRMKFSFSTPLVIENGGEKQLISPGSGMVGAYRPKDGKLLWHVRYGQGFSLVPRPVTDGTNLYISTGFMRPNLLAIDPAGAKGDVTDSKNVKWERTRFIPKTPSYVHSKGHLYIIDDTGMLTCVEAKSGEEKWRERIPGNFSASLTLVDDEILYALTEDGVAYVFEVSPKGAKTLLELDMKDRLFASPALVDGELFLRSEGALWKITGS